MDLFRKKEINVSIKVESRLTKCLTALDLTFFGVGAIIGAGIFILTGVVAATQAGPAIVFSYILAGVACVFAALSYAELASSIGGCGSAYGYAYASFGELIAWIVGWDLLLEYAISVSAVSVGWSSYFADFLAAVKMPIPSLLLHGPIAGGILNAPAVFIIATLTALLIMGVKSSLRINNLIVSIKLLVILLFIVIASTEIHVANWFPFMPFGWHGVINGASLIFFAYIGFDAVSTAAEEAINPQRDLPRGIIGSLIISTVLYIIVAGLLTGMAHYSTLNVASPISNVLLTLGYKVAASFISVGAIAGLTTVMLVLFYGLTRILLAMSRDGLLPKFIAKTSKNHHSPARIILLCGLLMALLSAFTPIDILAELVNVGTLFAFIIVCIGVVYLRYSQPHVERPFKVPGMPYIPLLGALTCFYLMIHLPWVTLIRFVVWMVLGLLIYFTYSRTSSVLATNKE
ncbi:amino acid permease [Legionella drancourtii]|uniref:Amino acid transporter n=1 Tax=Legionella drancourtii LLAP12 TaxID=658187 RepID=G9EJV3_9GAMM|nr:amino acid permease [Legionella drancourtii]EHL32513.1 amino acid transporter [Legionella drancourtii LLAP12]